MATASAVPAKYGTASNNYNLERSTSTTPAIETPVAQILQQNSEVNPDGSFHNVWQSDNGIQVQEQGTVKQVDDKTIMTVVGEVAYVDKDGIQYHLKYVADENGFHAEGAHLPTPPPLPVAIARSLEYIAAHPYHEEETEMGMIVEN